MDAAWRSRRPNPALQLTRAARSALQERVHFENQYQRIEAVPRREQLNANPLGGDHQSERQMRSTEYGTIATDNSQHQLLNSTG